MAKLVGVDKWMFFITVLLIVVGLVLSVLLAGVADAILVGVEHLVLPWRRAGAGARS